MKNFRFLFFCLLGFIGCDKGHENPGEATELSYTLGVDFPALTGSHRSKSAPCSLNSECLSKVCIPKDKAKLASGQFSPNVNTASCLTLSSGCRSNKGICAGAINGSTCNVSNIGTSQTCSSGYCSDGRCNSESSDLPCAPYEAEGPNICEQKI